MLKPASLIGQDSKVTMIDKNDQLHNHEFIILNATRRLGSLYTAEFIFYDKYCYIHSEII
jgi:hypothetical protein